MKIAESKVWNMNGKFFDLKKEKQDRMINAALKVFAQKGYRHASTDDIVKEAAISKGLLFHYFGSKLGLYTFIYDYSVRYMVLELKSAVSAKETNLFEILKQIEFAKIQALKGYPYMQQFLNRSVSEDVNEALMAVEEMRGMLADTYESLWAKIDLAGLPAGVDGNRLCKMIDFTVQGLMTEQFRNAAFQPDMLYEEICEYIGMLQKMVK